LNTQADSVRATVKRIIDSIKPLKEGFTALGDDDPLFGNASDRPSPVELDSLDALDLTMCLGDEFGLDNDEFERLIDSDEGLKSLRTVNDITELILSLSRSGSEGTSIAAPISERKEVKA